MIFFIAFPCGALELNYFCVESCRNLRQIVEIRGASLHITNLQYHFETPVFGHVIITEQVMVKKHKKHTVSISGNISDVCLAHDDVIKWKHFPRYWPFLRGIHRSPVNSPNKGQWRGALMFSLICAWINGWLNNQTITSPWIDFPFSVRDKNSKN